MDTYGIPFRSLEMDPTCDQRWTAKESRLEGLDISLGSLRLNGNVETMNALLETVPQTMRSQLTNGRSEGQMADMSRIV
jgi:hypothetical protein